MSTTRDNTLSLMTPILIEFGKAVHVCQIFEHSLCLLLSLLARETSEVPDCVFQTSWDFHAKKTLGTLLKLLREKIEVTEDTDKFLDEGIKIRNKIIHGFLVNNAMRLADLKGRYEIEQELVTLRDEIKNRDVVINELLDSLLKKLGTSNVQLKKNADRLWEHWDPKTPSF